MGENATEGIFIGVYIFVFVVALSGTIMLFYNINEYANLSYEYGKMVDNSGTLIEGVPATTYRVVTADELIGYYYNYIKGDISSNYQITVKDERGLDLFVNGKDYSYAEIIELVKPGSLYILNYESATEDETGKKQAKITIRRDNGEI